MKWLCTIIIQMMVMQALFGQFPEFKMYVIGSTDEDMLGQSSLADLDKDGDMDFIVGSNVGTIWWFEYQSADVWVKHVLGENALTDRGGVAVDVDGDGWIDQVSGGTWFKNTGKPRTEEFKRYENGAIYAYDDVAGDVNGDGHPDIIAMSQQEGVYWYDAYANPYKKWKKVYVGEGIFGGIYPNGVADMDKDKDMDIVRSNVWFDNTNGDGTKWVAHRTLSFVVSTGKFANSSRSYAVDFDKDGDMDLVQAESNMENGKIAWLENKDGKGINWYIHPIDNDTKQDLQALCVADFDNDGDLDIFSGGGPMTGEVHKRCYIWENADGQGTQWIRHEILIDIECSNAVAADVDGDGDIDICLNPWKGKTVYYIRNMFIESKNK